MRAKHACGFLSPIGHTMPFCEPIGECSRGADVDACPAKLAIRLGMGPLECCTDTGVFTPTDEIDSTFPV